MSLLLQLCLEINRGLWPLTAFWKIDILHDICQEWFWSDRYWLSVKEGQSFALNDKVHLLLNSTYTRPVACVELQISLAFLYILLCSGISWNGGGDFVYLLWREVRFRRFPFPFITNFEQVKCFSVEVLSKQMHHSLFASWLSSYANHNLIFWEAKGREDG